MIKSRDTLESTLYFAPAVKIVDGLVAVPIDIQQVDAHVVFDTATRHAQVEASMHFIMGNTDGNPVFDLRQVIQQAFLNDVSISTDKLQHHNFGGGSDAELRVVDMPVAANSENTLRLIYELNQPQSPNSQPIGWDMVSTRLYFDFWFSDLWPARYLEMWFPSNLIYDQFRLNLDIEIVNSAFAHVIMTNGQVSELGQNHWQVQFPERFTSFSPMLLLSATDRLNFRHGVMILPGTGAEVHLDTFKLTTTPADLLAVENNVRTYITNNVTNVGPYIHGDRFTTFIWTGSRSMEYDGGVTSNTGSLEHEVFHSWFGRGVKPASQNDSWIDEAWTQYSTAPNHFTLDPFDMSEDPVMLSSLNPFNRVTPGAAYSAGFRFFAGLAAALGLDNLRSYMNSFYQENQGRLVTTAQFELYLICKSSILEIADYFERFVYGFSDAAPGVDLYIRDDVSDPGVDAFAGPVFWNSPDLWIRNTDDGGTTHQDPEYGQDNWFHARVTNRGTVNARAFVVTFNVKPWAGTQFVYPNDFVPCISAAVGFNLAPGASTVVKAKWPAALVPPAGTHACWLVSVYTPVDLIPAGRHVWEHNNLAQKNLTVVDLVPGDSVVIPFQLGSMYQFAKTSYRIEVRRPQNWSKLPISIVHKDPKVISKLYHSIEEIKVVPTVPVIQPTPFIRFLEPSRVEIVHRGLKVDPVRLNLGQDSTLDIGSGMAEPELVGDEFGDKGRDADLVTDQSGATSVAFRPGLLTGFPVALSPRSPINVGLKITAPPEAKPGDVIESHLIQRNRQGQVVGGITVQVNIVRKRGRC